MRWSSFRHIIYLIIAVLLAGSVPVPLYPPASRARILEFMQRQVSILTNAGARLLISS